MKLKKTKSILRIFLLILTVSCNSVNHYNKKYEKEISVKKLKSDIDFIHNKLNKLHPHLYYYITKEALEYKFDSLSKSLNHPLTRNEFFFEISPIIAAIRQGHGRVFIPHKRYTKDESKQLNQIGVNPLSKLKLAFFDNKLYIIENNSIDSTLILGSEILLIDSINPLEIINKYRKTFTSDGFNETFLNHLWSDNFNDFHFLSYGVKDSLSITLKYNNIISLKVIKREKYTPIKKEAKLSQSKRKDVQKKCNLSFIGKDSCIALLQVTTFLGGEYLEYFKKIDSMGSTHLILDLRNNLGGYPKKAQELFSYLIDQGYAFNYRPEVTSKTSIIHQKLFKNKSIKGKIIHIAILPYFLLKYTIQVVATKKENDKYYHLLMPQTVDAAESSNFKGKIYVITNGKTFSASAAISSNLKGYNLATFVGEETGGAYNGYVAGIMPIFKLPHSKLKIRFGLMYSKPNCKTSTIGRGIMPDKEIIPTLEDRINNVDPELEWIIEDINKGN